jgi:hypothetical protein
MAGGGLAGEGQPSLCRLAQPLTFSLWLRYVKELGTRIATVGSKLNEDCIYIGAEREIRTLTSPRFRDFAVVCLLLGLLLH